MILPWLSEDQNLFTDNDMQDVFQKLRERGHHWARFIVNTSIGPKPACRSSEGFSNPANQVPVNLNLESDINWSGFTEQEVLTNSSVADTDMHLENSVAMVENEISPSSSDGNVVSEPSDDKSGGLGDDGSDHGLDD